MTSKYANYQQISDRLIQIYQLFVILTSISLTFLKLNKYSQLYWYLEEEIIKSQTNTESNLTFFFWFINRTLKTWVSKFITKQTNPKPLKHLTCLNLWRARERERERIPCRLFINIRQFSTHLATFWYINSNLINLLKIEQIFSAILTFRRENYQITNKPRKQF